MPTALEQLLARLAAERGAPLPEPAAPMSLGPLSNDTTAAYEALNPQPVPPRFTQPGPIDQGFVSNYAGAEPVRPVERRPGKLEQIAAILGGFGAGFQGNGPQYIAQLREQREAPMRLYERQREQFEDRRARGIELAERRAEREAEQANRANEMLYEREFKVWQQKSGIRNDEAHERMRQSFELEKEARRQRFETERELEREQRRREDDARTWAGRLGTGPGAAPPHIAKELGEFYANVRQSVSPAAAKWVNAQARRAELLARPALGGGAAASRREVLDLQRRTSQAAAGIAGMEKLARQAMESPEEKRGPILNQMRSMAQTLQAQFPELLEVGESGGWPYARLRLRGSGGPGRQQQQPPQPQADPLGILR